MCCFSSSMCRAFECFMMRFAAFLHSACGVQTGAGNSIGRSTRLMEKVAEKTQRDASKPFIVARARERLVR